MRKPKQDDITRGAVRQSQGRPQASTSIWRFGEWLSRRIWRSCRAGMWTINRDGKLVCESLSCKCGQPD